MSYITYGNAPRTYTEQVMSEIVLTVNDMLCEGLAAKESELVNIHPRTLISMLVTNILVHLLTGAIGSDNPIQSRLKMMHDTLSEVCGMSQKLWTALEASKADNAIAH